MEYVDPDKKRKHRQRIAIGYMLIGLMIAMISVIVLLAGYGYGFDRNTGQIVQNGIMFVDTDLASSRVSLNGEEVGQTDLRLVLREGDYDVLAQRDGYREWTRRVSIKGGKLRKLTYGLLIPETLQSDEQSTTEKTPSRALQSIDKDRIITWTNVSPNELQLYDLTNNPATVSILPLQTLLEPLITAGTATPSISDVEFIDFDSNDQRVLINVQIADKTHVWLIDTRDVESSFSVSASLPGALQRDAVKITMIDRNPNRFYVFDQSLGEAYQTELRNGSISLVTIPDIDRKVLDFVGFGSDWMLYVIESEGDEGLVDVMFRQGSETKLLKQVRTAPKYFLDLAKNGNSPFIAIGASSETAVFVYDDPIQYLKQNQYSELPAPSSIMSITDLLDVTISNDASVAMAFSATKSISYDYQTEETWQKVFDHTLESADQLRWMTGQIYTYVVDGTAWVVDFDGNNQQQLTAANAIGVFYRADSGGYFAFTANVSQEENALPTSFVFTSLLAEADR